VTYNLTCIIFADEHSYSFAESILILKNLGGLKVFLTSRTSFWYDCHSFNLYATTQPF